MLFSMRGAPSRMSTARAESARGVAADRRHQVPVSQCGDPDRHQHHAFGSRGLFGAGVSVDGGRWGGPGPG